MKLVSALIDDVTHYWNGQAWVTSLTQAKHMRTDEANELVRRIAAHNRHLDSADRIHAQILDRNYP